MDDQTEWLLALAASEPDLTLAEIRGRLAERGVVVGLASIWRFFARHRLSFKKTGRAAEQNRADVRAARLAWQAAQPTLDPARLVLGLMQLPGGSPCLS